MYTAVQMAVVGVLLVLAVAAGCQAGRAGISLDSGEITAAFTASRSLICFFQNVNLTSNFP